MPARARPAIDAFLHPIQRFRTRLDIQTQRYPVAEGVQPDRRMSQSAAAPAFATLSAGRVSASIRTEQDSESVLCAAAESEDRALKHRALLEDWENCAEVATIWCKSALKSRDSMRTWSARCQPGISTINPMPFCVRRSRPCAKLISCRLLPAVHRESQGAVFCPLGRLEQGGIAQQPPWPPTAGAPPRRNRARAKTPMP